MEEIEPVAAPLCSGDDVIIIVDDDRSWMNFAEKLGSVSGKPEGGIQAMIFRVPDTIRRLNADSFEPKIVSLGPYHHGKLRLRASDERIKLPYASNFFRDITDGNRSVVQRIFEVFKHKQLNARRDYSEEIIMTVNEFVEMMVLDCAFMAEFLLSRWESKKKHETELEERYSYPWTWATKLIDNDMLIFENQVPLYLLCQVLNEHTRLHNRPPAEFFLEYFIRDIHRNLSPNSEVVVSLSSDRTIAHLLHLFHGWLVSGLRRKGSHLQDVNSTFFPAAEILRTVRIHFANKTNCSSFLDITFDGNKSSMEIPQLVVNDENISLLRNLIALEQQCHGVGYYVSAYVWFMNQLIKTDKGVAVLRKHKIIVSRLRSDEEVAHIFNDLRRTDAPVVDLDNFYLAEETKKVNWVNY